MKLLKKDIPTVNKAAERLFSVCFVIIAAYLLCIITYILCVGKAEFSKQNSYDLFHSCSLSAIIALGGTLLLDIEIRNCRKK